MPHFDHEPGAAGLQRQTHQLIFQMSKLIVLVFVCVMTGSFAAVFGLSVYQSYFQIPDEVAVPVITGKDLAKANEILEAVHLKLSIQESRHTNSYPEGVIISQDPTAGRKVRRERLIMAVVSLGPELVDVPDLKGKTLREARILLSNNRLQVGKITFKEEKVGEPEQILEQRPAGGEKVAKGRSVDLQVQKGSSSATTSVPDWQGQPVYKIEDLIDRAHLSLGAVVWVFNDFAPRGEIVGQDPSKGNLVAYHSPMELQVSAGPTRDRLFKQRRLSIALPRGTRNQRVSVVLNSETGADQVFSGSSISGERLELMVAGWNGSEVEVYFNDRLQRRERL